MARQPKNKRVTPADAIKVLHKALQDPRLDYRKGHLSTDLADLHTAFPTDDDFTAAVLAVAREIAIALRNPTTYGKALAGNLKNLRRAAFPPVGSKDACLRLAIEPAPEGRMRLGTFRHRHKPPRPYALVRGRIPK